MMRVIIQCVFHVQINVVWLRNTDFRLNRVLEYKEGFSTDSVGLEFATTKKRFRRVHTLHPWGKLFIEGHRSIVYCPPILVIKYTLLFQRKPYRKCLKYVLTNFV